MLKLNVHSIFLRFVLIVSVIQLSAFGIYAQSANNLFINSDGYYLLPSEVGAHNQKWVAGAYINSQSILKDMPIRAYAFSGDYQLKNGLQKIYAGLGISSHQLISSPYHENEFYASLAFHKIFNQHTFHFGIQSGLYIRELSGSSLLFPDQYDRNTGGYTNAIPTNEPLDYNNKAINFNLSGGIAYGLKMNKLYSKLSINIRNINSPNLSFTSSPNKLPMQLIIYNQNNYYLNELNSIKIFDMLTHNGDKTGFYIGGDLIHQFTTSNLFLKTSSIGSYLAFNSNDYPNKVVFNVAFGLPKTKVGFAYSYNFIGNKSATSFNAFEIMLVQYGLFKKPRQFEAPCTIN